MGNTVKAVVAAFAANAVALAVAFGVHISPDQKDAILAFVGSVTTIAVAVVGWVETHHVRANAQVKVAETHVAAAAAAAPAK